MEAVFEQKLAKKAGITLAQANALTPHIFDAIIEGTVEDPDGRFRLEKLGAFSVVQRNERPGRNPQTGEPITIPAKEVVRFTPYKDFKAAVNPALPEDDLDGEDDELELS